MTIDIARPRHAGQRRRTCLDQRCRREGCRTGRRRAQQHELVGLVCRRCTGRGCRNGPGRRNRGPRIRRGSGRRHLGSAHRRRCRDNTRRCDLRGWCHERRRRGGNRRRDYRHGFDARNDESGRGGRGDDRTRRRLRLGVCGRQTCGRPHCVHGSRARSQAPRKIAQCPAQHIGQEHERGDFANVEEIAHRQLSSRASNN